MTFACTPNSGEEPAADQPTGISAEEADQSQGISRLPVDVLSEGFYGEQSGEALNTTTESLDPEPIELLEATPRLVDTDQQILPAVPKAKDSIVEDFEFSTADDVETVDEPENFKPFCLGLAGDTKPDKGISPEEACLSISNRLASVTNKGCIAAQLQPTQCHSVSGFPILVREFTPLPGKPPQGRILVLGGTHGDELTSVSITFKWIERLNKHHSGLFHWRVAPLVNPDGVLKRAATRTNQNGVDLNRNLPSDDWEANALDYWEDKQNKNPRRYPGETAASEPETKWLIDEIEAFKPDAIISVHAPYGVVDFDSLVLNTAPKTLGHIHLNLLGTYPGSLGNYAGINRNIPVITLELPHSWVMPSEAETLEIWEDTVGWLRKNVGQSVAGSDH
ncbi:MAG: murein peptide amidase A [Gammaproteobacteria bacterium]|nr:murein peptide amidase A [Gammaproteobacteria bacterium]